MELKRYALTNDNTIITDIRHCSYDDKKYEYAQSRSKEGVVFMRDLMVSQVKKTSDNILDLVEVGDLVCLKDDYFNNGTTIHEVLEIRGRFIRCLTYVVQIENILAIYKLQPNGDYKRYEVKA